MNTLKTGNELQKYSKARIDLDMIPESHIQVENKENASIQIYIQSGVDIKNTKGIMKRLASAFPDLNPDFFEVLMDVIIEEQIPGERLKKAVDRVIKECVYPKPTVAEILKFNPKIKLRTYHSLLQEYGDTSFSRYYVAFKRIDNIPWWADKSDLDLNNINY